LKVGDLFGVLDLIVGPIDDHNVVMGKYFMRSSKAIYVPHMNCLMFMDETKTCGLLMVTRRKMG